MPAETRDFDAGNDARTILGDPTLPADPHELDRDQLRDVALRLRNAGLSYGDISGALRIPKTTVYRWTEAVAERKAATPAATSADTG